MIFYDKDYLASVDSFARGSDFYKITGELNSASNEVPFQFQHFFSDVCGEYVIYFSYNLCRKKTLEGYYVLSRFSFNCKDNDNKVAYQRAKLLYWNLRDGDMKWEKKV